MNIDIILSKIKWFFKYEFYFYIKRLHKKYYIIRRHALGAGFFSNYFWVLGHIEFAKKLGYIPVVDMENYPVLYSEEKAVNGTKNAWNYYFENVGDVDLQTAYDSSRYVLCKETSMAKYAYKYSQNRIWYFPTEKMISYYAPVIQNDMKMKADIRNHFEEEWNRMTAGRGKIIGIHVRGTDMKNNLGHPMPVTVEIYLQKLDDILKQDSSITDIYLATDEINVLERFEQEYQDRKVMLHYQDAFRVRDNGEGRKTGVHETKVEHARELHKYKMGLEVLQDAYFLSKCNYFICGYSNVTNAVILWNNHEYEQVVLCSSYE